MKPIAYDIFKDQDFSVYLYPLSGILYSDKNIKTNYEHWFNDLDVTQYNSHGVFPFYPLDDIDNYLNSPTRIVWGIVVQKDDDRYQHIGNISLQEIDLLNRTAEVSCIIGEVDYWSKGIMTWALQHLIRHGFQSLGLNRLWAGTAAVNLGMARVFDKLGFAHEGIRKEDMYLSDKFVDVLTFGLLKSMWKVSTSNQTQSPKSIAEKIIDEAKIENLTPIDKIECIRANNNRNWMDILRLAYRMNPATTKSVIKEIIAHDKQITTELEKIMNEE